MINPKKKIVIIGSGIAGLASAIDLACKGHEVIVLEKNASYGGRARTFKEGGFTFDMGPSWYWMPDIFEDFFKKHNLSLNDRLELTRLDPSYRMFFKEKNIDSSADVNKIFDQFESIEKGSSNWLKNFLQDAKYKYEVGMNDFVRKPALSIFEFIEWRLIKGLFKLDLTVSIEKVIDKNIKHPYLRSWLKFPVLFLGAKPKDTPSLYSLMNYADLVLGTWYPKGGMIKLFDAMYQLALDHKVKFIFNEEVNKINCVNKTIQSVTTSNHTYECDYLLSAADYHHTETLLDIGDRQYSQVFWDKQVMAPSALIFFLGVSEKLDGLLHHNLFFDEDFNKHGSEIYDEKVWPRNPLFYVCNPSKTDSSVAPSNCENLFILVPIATGMEDLESEKERLFSQVIKRLENKLNQNIQERIIFKKTYSINNFIEDYHSFRGNAYGLSNILSQTAFFKPRLKHKKIQNMYFAGQLSHPGPGLPPSMISGEIAASLILKKINESRRTI